MDAGGPALRQDAERNRDRVLAAAREAYAAEGIGASMASIARRAGVGIATVFRRFPTREALVEAVFADRMTAYAQAVELALADPDPWAGFAGYVETVCGMQAADRGFGEVLTLTFPTARALEERRDAAYHGLVALLDRAKAAGRLRTDVVPEDMVVLLMANAGVVAATGDAAPDAWRRHVAHQLRGFAVDGGEVPAPPAPTPSSMYRAMLRAAPTTSGRARRTGPAPSR
ncbi:TetR/AcrR family transcriptional regulator [Pseudonocardia pini]|uniref:TetR/AcrR family transcriptional regulator n=1 Tax=Pseudonocardia pini TaxID=2758030 RepID=UPI0015F08735|nr:TetR/AcrR family transcriptional regulator [Pseudonocardia pini]